jgi:hypothetical protein
MTRAFPIRVRYRSLPDLVAGVHVHLSHEHAAGFGHDDDFHFTSMSEGADHIAAHLHHGDVDLDGPAKVPTLKLSLAVFHSRDRSGD